MCATIAQKFPCPGVAVNWTLGSIWDTYPYQVHAHWSLGWQPVAFLEANNTIIIHADSCTGNSKQCDTVCQYHGGLLSTNKFRDFVDWATDVSDFANSEYLNAKQLQAAMRWLSTKCQQLQTKVLFFLLQIMEILIHNISFQTQNANLLG
jgi:hypothetical protein